VRAVPISTGSSRIPWLRSRLMPAVALSAAALAVSCGDDALGPREPLRGTFAIAPGFASGLAGIVPLREARITLRDPGSESIVVDTVIPIAVGDTAVDLSLVVPVVSAQQVFVLTVQLVSTSGAVAFQGGPIDVKPSVGSGAAVPIELALQYVGVGSNAAGVRILTPDLALYSGQTAPVVAEAFDSAGQAIQGTPIGFTSLAPQSAAFPDEAVGQVVAGAQRGTARLVATLLTGQADSISAAVQPVPTQIAIVSGGSQSAEVSQPLASPVVLEVRGGDGLPIAGVTVRLSTPDNGAVAPDSVVTATDGRVTFTWTLGSTSGTQTVLAHLVEFPAVQATVTATATAKPATAIAIASGDAQTGPVNALLADSLVILATDIDGYPAPDVTIRWTVIFNDGTVSPTNSVTDASGLAATAWTLGSLAGANRVEASLPGSGAPSVIFTATGLAGPAAILELVSGDAQADTVGATLTQPLVVRVTDLFGNPVAGTAVAFGTPDGGSLVPASTTSDSLGLSQSVWTVGPATGTQTATATSGGLGGSPVTFTATVSSPPRQNAWTGAAGDGLWTTAGNWSLNREPAVTDTAVIGISGIVYLRATRTVNRVEITSPGATLSIGTTSTVGLTVADGFANAGTIVITNEGLNASAALTVTSGTLVNTGLIEATAGQGGVGSRTLAADVDNQGTISATSYTFTLANTGRTFGSTAGTLATPNGNTITLSGGTVQFGAATVFTGRGVVSLPAGTTLELPSDFTLPAGDYRLDLAGAGGISVNGPGTFTVADTLVLTADTINAPLSIPGRVEVRRGGSRITGALVVTPTGLLRVGDTGSSDVTVATGFTNAGTIVLTNDQLNASAALTVTSGTLVNTGTITAQFGFGGAGARTVTATIDNQGTLTAESFNLTVQNAGRTLSTTAGTLATPNGNAVILNGGTVVFGSGTRLTGRGTFSLPVNTTLTLASDFTLAAADYRLDLAAGQGISVNGPGTFTVLDTLVLQADTIGAPLNLQGQIEARAGTSYIDGALSIASSGLLRIGDVNPAAVTVAGGFTNAGTIVLTNDQLNASAALTVTSGTLVNTGTIAAQFGFGGAGARTVTGSLDNRGSVTLGFPLGIAGQLLSPAGTTGSVSGSGSILSVAGLDVDDMTFDNVPLVSTGGTIAQFDNVTFQNMATDAIQLTVNHPGAATPFTFNGVRFLTAPATGRYIRANDTNTGDGTPLTINMAGSTPADGSAYEDEQNGAVINWGAAAPAINVWTATSGMWSNGAAWSLGRTPIAGDTVHLTQGLDYAVTLDVSPTIAKLVIGGTADVITLNVGDQTLTITDAGVDPGLDILPLGNVQVANGSLSVNRLVNNGTVWITGVASLAASAVSNYATWQVAGGQLTVTHPTSYDFQQLSGRLDVASGAELTFGANGALSYFGGGIGGSAAGTFGTIVLTPNVGLILGADLTYDSLTIEIQDGFTTPLAAERLTVGPDATLVLNSSTGVTLNNVVANQGTMIALGEQNFPNDSLYNAAGAELRLDGTAGSVALIVNRALDNAGDIRFTNTSAGRPARLIVYAEDLTNRPSGTIISEVGDGTGLHGVDAQLINDGTITLQHDFLLQRAQPARDHHVNNGTILVVGGTFELLQNGTDATFTNDGILYATGGDILVTQDAATARVTSSSALLVGANRALTFGGTSTSGALDVTAGLLTVDGALTAPDSMYVRSGAVVQGGGTIDVSSVVGGDLSGDVVPGPAGAAGTLTFGGDVPFAAGSVIYTELGGPAFGASDLISVSGTATLDGTIDATALLPGYTPVAGDTIPILAVGQIAGQPTFALPTPPVGVLVSQHVVDNVGAPDTVYVAFSGTVQPGSGEILFAGDSAFGLSTGIFSVGSDGTGLANVFPTASFPAQAVYPRWSPDRSRIAFGQTAGAGGTNQLVVISADGAEIAVAVTDTNVALARWSPDPSGSHLAFVCYGYDVQFQALEDVCVIDDATGSVPSLGGIGDGAGKTILTQLVASPDRARGPGAFAWNPQNPDQIAFVRDSSDATSAITSSRIYSASYSAGTWTVQPLSGDIMDVGTGALRVQSAWLDWSADGQWLGFAASDPQGRQRIYRVNFDGTGLRALTSGLNPSTGGPAADDDPLISPNGTELLYSKLDYNACSFDAWIVDDAGTREEQVTDEGLCDFPTEILGYDWSPTGVEFTFTGFQTPGAYDNLIILKAPRTLRRATYLTARVLVGRIGGAAPVTDIQPSWRP
jgi:hypothetical protein